MTTTETNIDVDCPVRVVYDQWTQFEQFPQFMTGVRSVEQLSDARVRWTVEIGGLQRQWEAEIVEQVPDRSIAWASVSGARNAGRVSFEALDDERTQVTLELTFEPDGLADKLGDTFGVVGRRAETDLENFKEFLEARGRESGAWRGRIDPAVAAAPTQADRLLREA